MKNRFKHFVIYSLIGFSGVFLDLFMFYILYEKFNISHQIANVFSTSLGIGNNFLLNAFFNFKKTDNIWVRFIRFYAIGMVGLLATAAFLYVTVDRLGFDATLSKMVSVVGVVLLQYALNKKYSFGNVR